MFVLVITCPALELPTNMASIDCSNGVDYGTECIFTCEVGYGLVGSAVLTCQGDGSSINGDYDVSAPSCEGMTNYILNTPPLYLVLMLLHTII